MTQTDAGEFMEHVNEGDKIRVENSEGGAWTGKISVFKEEENGQWFKFGEHSVARYYSDEHMLQFGPGGQHINKGIHVPATRVVNETRDIEWTHPES